ncbi:MAG: cation-translocating P-type ATPase [Firmicutes bacterium]|nr:cation-translocating P-type ATPase [Bacillota bacterium]
MREYHLMTAEEALAAVSGTAGAGERGLSRAEATRRLREQGENLLPAAPPPSLVRRFLGQLTDPMVMVLLLSALLSSFLGEWTDAAIIAGVVLANAALSLFQEGRAERATAALARLTAEEARVRRQGEVLIVPGRELVVGDVVLLEAGDVVPADLRLLSAFDLRCDESSLSGEALPAEKSAAACPPPAPGRETPLSDRSCLAFMGCPVTRGRGEGVVVACGPHTVMGRMAGLMDGESSPPTPLQRRLNELSRKLSLGVGAICLLVFVLSLLRGGCRPLDAFLLAVSLAVAAVPEGLVVVVTLVLSLGVAAMSRKNALARSMSAVESLGAVQVICADKTGTLTQNRMTVTAWVGPPRLLAEAGALCSHVSSGGEGLVGEPTETALAAFAAAWGVALEEAALRCPLLSELPFDSGRKLMSTLHRREGSTRQYTKGAFERVLERCTAAVDDKGRPLPLDEERRRLWQDKAEEMAGKGLRVLAAAFRDGLAEPAEEGLTLIGLYGISDPPRPGAAEAVAAAKAAGVTTMMISGDNAMTATAIGRELGLLPKEGPLPPDAVISGEALSSLSDRELTQRLARVRVFARVTPEDKLRIVKLWQKKGRAVAMTGDGVNDAPALTAADIGVGMGKNGAEVCRRASGLVLADDDFSTIVAAIREGRRIYDNIRRAIQFLLSSNLAEVLTIFAASCLGLSLFLPVHLLWINLITDCLPAVALGLEAAAPDVMKRPPRARNESVFAGGMAGAILRHGCYMAGLTLAAFYLGAAGCRDCAGSAAAATAMAFVTLSTSELLQAWNMRSGRDSLFSLPTSNPALAAAVLVSIGLDLLLLYWPPLSAVFYLTPLTPRQLLLSAALSFAIVPLVELDKLMVRHMHRR